MSDLLVTVIVAVAMLVGLAGVVIPILPGLALIWAAALAYGLQVGFGVIGVVVMILLSVLTVASIVFGVILPKRAASESGASNRTQLIGVVGAVVGFFVIPVVGIVVGALVAVLLAEYADKRNWSEARTATIGVAKGFGISSLVQLAIGMVMLAIWSLWALTVLV